MNTSSRNDKSNQSKSILQYDEINIENRVMKCCNCRNEVRSNDPMTGQLYASPLGLVFEGHDKITNQYTSVVFAVCHKCLTEKGS